MGNVARDKESQEDDFEKRRKPKLPTLSSSRGAMTAKPTESAKQVPRVPADGQARRLEFRKDPLPIGIQLALVNLGL